MKNISRRVFIKGMAVAAVATAASTVLTGCKFPGTDAPAVEKPTNSNVLKFVDPDNSDNVLTITAKDLVQGLEAYGDEKSALVTLSVENELGQQIRLITSDADAVATKGFGANQYYVLVEAYADGLPGRPVTVTAAKGLIYDNTSNAGAAVADGKVKKDTIELDFTNQSAKSTVTLKLTVKRIVDANASNEAYKKMASQEFVYTL